MPTKLTDPQIAEMHSLKASGVSVAAIAERFDVSRQYVGRVLDGRARAQIGGLDRNLVEGSVVAAVESFLAGLELDDGQAVLAETARALASKLDRCTASESSAAASASPAVAKQLLSTVETLRGRVRGTSPLDEIRARRDAKVLALAAQQGA